MTVIANTIKTILISVDLSELRVAVLEEGRTVETYIERNPAYDDMVDHEMFAALNAERK